MGIDSRVGQNAGCVLQARGKRSVRPIVRARRGRHGNGSGGDSYRGKGSRSLRPPSSDPADNLKRLWKHCVEMSKTDWPEIRGRTISASGDPLRVGLRKWVFPHSQLTPPKLPHSALNAALILSNNRPHCILRPLPSRTFTVQQGLATTVTTIVTTKVSSRSTPSLANLERFNPS